MRSGTVKAQVPAKDGELCFVEVVTAGGTLGVAPVLCDQPNDTEFKAQTPVHLCEIDAAAFRQLLQANFRFCGQILSSLSDVVHRLQRRLLYLNQGVTARVAEALVHLFSIDGEQKWSRKDIAGYAGTTVESVIRALAGFEKRGLIRKQGRSILIVNRDQLKQESRGK